MIIDTHAHTNFKAFENDREEVIKECLNNQTFMVNIGTNIITSIKAIELAQKYENVWASVGLHPIHLATNLQEDEDDDPTDEKDFDYQKYKELAQNPKVVAIGEMGLDYYYLPQNEQEKIQAQASQTKLLLQELELAKELKKACILHCRMAYNELLDLLWTNTQLAPERAVLHCFMANLDQLKQFLDLGFFIGYNGIIFKQIPGINFEELIKATPDERIVLETDCPYLIHPSKKGQRNTPMGVLDVLNEIARIKQKDPSQLAEIYNNNAKRLFEIEF